MTFDMTKVIPKEKMIKVITDLQIVDGAVATQAKGESQQSKYAQVYLDYVLKENNITKEELDESIRYYAYHIEELDKIYEQVIINLSKTESEIKKEKD